MGGEGKGIKREEGYGEKQKARVAVVATLLHPSALPTGITGPSPLNTLVSRVHSPTQENSSASWKKTMPPTM